MAKKMWIVGITSIQADLDPELRGPSEETTDLFTVFCEEEKVVKIINWLNCQYDHEFIKKYGHAPGNGMYDDYTQFYYTALPDQISLYELRSKLSKYEH